MNYATITMNYRRANSAADELDELAEQLTKMAQSQMGDSLQDISNNWKGESAELFIRKGENLQQQIVNSAKKLKDTAAAVRKIAQTTRNADLQALEIAMRRTYK